MKRRTFLRSAAVSAIVMSCLKANCEDEALRAIPLGFSLYNMKSLAIDDAIATVAKIGYDCTELPVLAGWPGDSAKLTAAQIKSIRDALAKNELALTALMENLQLVNDAQHETNLQRLRRAGELAHELSPAAPPVIETILGGAAKDWEANKAKMV